MKNPIKNPVTTISGMILIILSGLTLFGVITSDQSTELGGYAQGIIEAILGIIAIFKAGDKGGGV